MSLPIKNEGLCVQIHFGITTVCVVHAAFTSQSYMYQNSFICQIKKLKCYTQFKEASMKINTGSVFVTL